MDNRLLTVMIILAANTLIAVLYLVWGLVYVPVANAALHNKENKGKSDAARLRRGRYVLRSFIILLCPVIGIFYFGCSNMLHRIFFHKDVDLSAVIFSKEKIRQVLRSDMEQEINFASIEEAVAVSDYQNQRQLMMNVLRSDIKDSLGSISLALNSQDSETSHYAATALRDELGGFRSNVQKMWQALKKNEKNKTEQCCEMIEYMYPMLKQSVFPISEQRNYVNMLNELVDSIYELDKTQLKPAYYEWLIDQLLGIENYSEAERWCTHARNELKGQLIPYKCCLKLYYSTHNSRQFFETMQELRESNIPIDSDTLETFRMFN